MKKTINYGFNLPETGDFYNLNDYNANFEEIDTKLKEASEGVVDADTVDGWHIYSNPNEVGFSGEFTMALLCSAMKDKTQLHWVNTKGSSNSPYASDVPATYGMLSVIKRGTWCYATWIAINAKTKTPLYAGSWHSENGWTGWSSVADYLPLTGGALSSTLNISPSTGYPMFNLINNDTGRTAHCNSNSAQQTSIFNMSSKDGSNNSTALVLSTETDTLDNLLRIARTVNGSQSVYKTIHTGNMGTHVLPRVGGTLTGNLGIHRTNHGTYSLNNTSFARDGSVPNEMQYGNFLVYDKDGKNIGGMQNFVYTTGNIATALVAYQNTAESKYGLLGVKANADGTIKPYFYQNGSPDRDVLHTGNKPIGSYTGDGSSTTRNISTGGIGNVVVIYSEYGVALITPAGGFYGYSGSSFSHFPSETATFSNGVIKLVTKTSTEKMVLNTSGATYYYQVL